MSNSSERSRSKLHEMIVLGTEFRDDYEFELYGEPVTAVLQPLIDEEFLPIAAFLAAHFGLEDDSVETEEAVSEAIDRVEEARQEGEDEDEPIDVSKLDEDFVAIMQEAARKGMCGAYDDEGEEVEHTDEEIDFMVENMMGGYSVEIGGRVLEISGDVRDAEKFRGFRSGVESSGGS